VQAGTRSPEVRVVVAMGDAAVREITRDGTIVEQLDVDPDALPLARARNVGAARAMQEGADLLVFLDVDCLAGRHLLARYAQSAEELLPRGHVLLNGPVAYLPRKPEGESAAYTEADLAGAGAHPGRPDPPDGTSTPGEDHRLFWSLSFAVSAQTWRRIGGFDEGYVGYGGEDTDFGQRARSRGVTMWWIGGATAYHQWHPVSDPPVDHAADVVRNANRFQQRWGWFPMTSWLEGLRGLGHVAYEERSNRWLVTDGSAPRV
jgi:N-acetylglucosaminyl-diphospho-decaprenol L-rhamnosyltransferase